MVGNEGAVEAGKFGVFMSPLLTAVRVQELEWSFCLFVLKVLALTSASAFKSYSFTPGNDEGNIWVLGIEFRLVKCK